MMKNMEWGAVAYLSHSKYGINGEITMNNVVKNTTTYITQTGCAASGESETTSTTCQNEYDTERGMKASTTGNIYGIYDMSVGIYDRVMGVQTDNTTLLDIKVAKSGFVVPYPEPKYYDMYTYNSSFDTMSEWCQATCFSA